MAVFVVFNLYSFDDLWVKAKNIAENSKYLVAGKTIYSFKHNLVSEKDLVDIDFVYTIAHTLDPYNQIHNEVISVDVRSNIGMPDDFAFNFDGIIGLATPLSMNTRQIGTGLFFVTDIDKLLLERLDIGSEINGRDCVAFKFLYKTTGVISEIQEGIIWLDRVLGVPLLVESKIIESKYDISHLQSFSIDDDVMNLFDYDKNHTDSSVISSVHDQSNEYNIKHYYDYDEQRNHFYLVMSEHKTVVQTKSYYSMMVLTYSYHDYFEFTK